jgi:hypothetical protein
MLAAAPIIQQRCAASVLPFLKHTGNAQQWHLHYRRPAGRNDAKRHQVQVPV